MKNWEAVRPLAARVYRTACAWGIDPLATARALRGTRQVRAERREYNRQRLASGRPDEFPIASEYRIYGDRSSNAGVASGHYFHQDLLVAREIFTRQPRRHVDVGSAIYGFVAHVAAFREIEVIDIRPVDAQIVGIRFVQQDMMAEDPAFAGYTDSLSCLHALEHFGLGRYGDPVDYAGWRRGLQSLYRMLEIDGVLYLSVPTGSTQRVEFNAHRVFSLPFLRDVLLELFTVERLSFVDDTGALIAEVDPFGPDAEASFGATYGLSIWILRKRPNHA